MPEFSLFLRWSTTATRRTRYNSGAASATTRRRRISLTIIAFGMFAMMRGRLIFTEFVELVFCGGGFIVWSLRVKDVIIVTIGRECQSFGFSLKVDVRIIILVVFDEIRHDSSTRTKSVCELDF